MSTLKARLVALESRARQSAPRICIHVFPHDGPCVPGAPFDHARAIARLAPGAAVAPIAEISREASHDD